MPKCLRNIGLACYGLTAAPLCLFGAYAVLSSVTGGEYYEQPYACGSLECTHKLATAPDGGLYCTKWPPRDIMLASVPARTKLIRRRAGALCAAAGLACALWMIGDSALRLLGRPTPPRSPLLRWILCLAAPPVSLVLYACATLLYAVYGFVPM